MALGFGFNKQKVLASAEKAVQQGKLQNAITEYEKITKEDPKDLTVLNTIGDLYARVGNGDKAAIYFKKVGDIYAAEGFTVKAIAMYKKLTKSQPTLVDAVLKLAELYTQQGLYNDARAQYVLVADQALKAGELESASSCFRKILELDPENTAMQSKLAETYIKLGKKPEAQNIFMTAAQNLYARGAMDAAEESLRRVLQLDPKNIDAMLLRGRIAADSGDGATAVQALEQVPDIDNRLEGLQALLRAYIMLGQFDHVSGIAQKLLSVHNDISGITTYAEALLAAGQFPEAIQVYGQFADKLLAANSRSVLDTLQTVTSRIKDSSAALSGLLALYRKAGETAQIGEVTELLAHAYVNDGQLSDAAELYKELALLEPENPLHHQNYKQLMSQLSNDPASAPMSAEMAQGPAMPVDELTDNPPPLEQKYSDELADDLRAAITDAELFDSYNLPAKAIAPLEAILPNAAHDVQVNSKLASLYARTGRFEDAARRCDTLQSVYAEAGQGGQSEQYAEMAAKYRERAAADSSRAAVAAPAPPMAPPASFDDLPATSEEAPAMGGFAFESVSAPAQELRASVAPAVFDLSPPEQPAATGAAALELSAQPAPDFSMEVTPPPLEMPIGGLSAEVPASGAHEIDLSNEWESMTDAPASAPVDAGPSPNSLAEQVKMSVAQGALDEARAALARLEALAPGFGELPELRMAIAAASTPAAPPQEATVAEFSFEMEVAAPEPAAPPPLAPPSPPVAAPVKVTPSPPPAPMPAPARVAAAPAAAGSLSDFVLELDESLGDDFNLGGAAPPPAPKPVAAIAAVPVPAPAKIAPPPPPAPEMPPSPVAKAEVHEALSDLFDEFKEDVEQSAGSEEVEDPDTHYNLGVAFKEMGLLDEAIGELQKVAQAIDHGHPFTQVIQAYTWLASCFIEKGVPEAAVKWYQKALTTPNLDNESKLAVYYELANAHELAGDKPAAIKNFMEVYGTNIDYRDVAERIKGLRG